MTRLTFRERIMRHWVARFEEQTQGQDDALITWDVVSRKPLTKNQQLLGNAMGIYDTSEKVIREIGHDKRFLNIVLEFNCKISDGETDDVASILNEALGEVQRVAGLDPQLGEPDPDAAPGGPSYKLAINTLEKGNEIDIGGEKPQVVTGVVIVEVEYRTKNNNPYER